MTTALDVAVTGAKPGMLLTAVRTKPRDVDYAVFDHFRLVANGKALANYPVDLTGSDGQRQHLTIDARGDVRIGASAKGRMMLFAAKLEPPAKAERFTLDLTSLTFNRP